MTFFLCEVVPFWQVIVCAFGVVDGVFTETGKAVEAAECSPPKFATTETPKFGDPVPANVQLGVALTTVNVEGLSYP